jgi:hypothetical protein
VLPDRDRIERTVDLFLGQIRSRKAGKDSARRLYEILVDPVGLDRIIRRVIVVPDGKLHLLLFDLLVDSRGNYLFACQVVTYSSSSTVFHLLRRQPENASAGQWSCRSVRLALLRRDGKPAKSCERPHVAGRSMPSWCGGWTVGARSVTDLLMTLQELEHLGVGFCVIDGKRWI